MIAICRGRSSHRRGRVPLFLEDADRRSRYTLSMSEIIKPTSDFTEIDSVSAFLQAITDWRAKHSIAERGFHSRVWYRGHSKSTYSLVPGVYRSEFTSLARKCC